MEVPSTTAISILLDMMGERAVPILSEGGGIRGFFEKFVPDAEDSLDPLKLKISRGIAVMMLMKSDPLPIVVGSTRQLMVGSLGAAYNKETLIRFGVSHIITVGENMKPKFPESFQYKVIQVKDLSSEDLGQHFLETIDFIETSLGQKGRVFVHCFMGKSRSCTMVCAYLMKKLGLRYDEALSLLCRSRPQAQPNPGFTRQLLAFQKSLFGDDDTKMSAASSPSCDVADGRFMRRSASMYSPRTTSAIVAGAPAAAPAAAGGLAGSRPTPRRTVSASIIPTSILRKSSSY